MGKMYSKVAKRYHSNKLRVPKHILLFPETGRHPSLFHFTTAKVPQKLGPTKGVQQQKINFYHRAGIRNHPPKEAEDPKEQVLTSGNPGDFELAWSGVQAQHCRWTIRTTGKKWSHLSNPSSHSYTSEFNSQVEMNDGIFWSFGSNWGALI